MKSACLFLLPLFLLIDQSFGLDNGLARTPPMGWMSWQRFRCNTNCKDDPENCISERLFKTMADLLVSQGFKDVGYEYIIIDDCWLSRTRDKDGKLQPDPERFPSGIKALADYVHNLGLKFGIYEDFGTHTCAGYPGILNSLKKDAFTIAEWEVDYLKVDGCYVNVTLMDKGYPEFGKYLNQTGRPILYSCSWPAYQKNPDYKSIAKYCNIWRNGGDIQDSFNSVLGITDFFGTNQDTFISVAGPGHFNDPDMLIIGDFALSIDQSQYQMAVWATLAAPLIMSNDLRSLRPEFKEILQNRKIIRVNQDPLGIHGRRVYHEKNIDVFVKQVLPSYRRVNSAAVAICNRGEGGTPVNVTFTASSLGLENPGGYYVSDLFTDEFFGIWSPLEVHSLFVNPNGVRLLRFNVKAAKKDLPISNDEMINPFEFIFKVQNYGARRPIVTIIEDNVEL
uniref:Alpha-galactosidase n=1 Tax=Lepeophtheirus salmonis TaxID=72036 RepID=A0A0K2U878_LEPSM